MILRGNGGQDIFFEDENRYHVYGLLHQGGERSRHRLQSFCCMPNHLHLAIQVKETPLSQIMHNLSFRYTRWINHKHTCGVAMCCNLETAVGRKKKPCKILGCMVQYKKSWSPRW